MRKVLLVLCLLVMSSGAWAQSDAPKAPSDAPKVAVAPFAIHSHQDAAKVRQSLQEVLNRQFEAAGLKVVAAAEAAKAAGARDVDSEAEARSLGAKLQAGFVVIGSFSQVGDYLSIDAKLVDVSGQKKTEVLFAEEKGMENLASAAKQISQQASLRLLSKAVVTDIRVKGNNRVEADAIKANVKSVKGELLRPDQVSQDIKAINKMGFFEEVQADVSDNPEGGKTLTFIVRENPNIQEVNLKGNKKIDDKDIRGALSTKAHAVLQKNVVNDDVQRVLKLYQEKAYLNAEVTPVITYPKDPRDAVVTFEITEHKKVYIDNIKFVGNNHFWAWELHMTMETKEKGWFWWLTDYGIMQKEKLDTDSDRLTAFYYDHGYMDVKVAPPKVVKTKEGIMLEIVIEEGERYKIAGVSFDGDKLVEEKHHTAVKKALKSKEGAYFSRENLRDDIDMITKAYNNEGRAKAEVTPDVRRDPATHTSTIVFNVKSGKKYRIGKITIFGNTKTEDRVIRRNMGLAEGDEFSAIGLERSTTNLKKLEYFETVDITPADSPDPDILNLNVKVKEKMTGSFTVGGGYGSQDGLFASAEITQKNLWGTGIMTGIKAYVGQENTKYTFNITQPSIMESLVSLSTDIYDWRIVYSDFVKDSYGTKLKFGYPFGDFSRIYFGYTWEHAIVKDVTSADTTFIANQAGTHIKGSIAINPVRDTTDHPFLPTKGSVNSFVLEYASKNLGGDADYMSIMADSGWYFPLLWKFVGYTHFRYGYLDAAHTSQIPIYDRYFLGGINSMRGWNFATLGPKDLDGNVVGGTQMAVFNAELLFPLLEKYGMRGVLFFDAGNAWDTTIPTFPGTPQNHSPSFSSFRTDVGPGIRWNSPLGPIRVEYGYNLNRQPGEDRGAWQFTMGAFF